MTFFEGVPHGGGVGQLDGEGGVGAVIAELRTAGDLDTVVGDVLRAEFGAGRRFQVVGRLEDRGQGGVLQPRLDGLFAHRRGVGKADAQSGQDTGHGRHEDGADAEEAGDHARVLAGRRHRRW